MEKKIKNVEIIEGCISCGSCEIICPSVFKMNNKAQVKENVDFQKHEKLIIKACDICPVQVIKIIEDVSEGSC